MQMKAALYSSIALLVLSTAALAQEPEKIQLPELPKGAEASKKSDTNQAAPVAVVTESKAEQKVEPVETTPLRKALEAAYTGNPELEAQRKTQKALDESVPQALSGALPTASVGYEKGRRRTSFGGTDWSYADALTKNLSVTQPIFRGGSTWANVKAARNEVRAGQERLKQAEQDILLQAVTVYMDVVRTQSVMELSRKNLTVLEKQMAASQQRFDVGEDTRTDVAQSEARVALAKSQLVKSEGDYAAAKAAFKRTIGYEAPENLPTPDISLKLPDSLQEAIELADKNNPRLKEAEYLKESADYTINSNVGRLLPSVNLRGAMNRQEGAGVTGTSTFDQDEVLLAVSVPLFQGGAEYSRVREAKENYQRQRFSELDMANRVRQLAISAWEDWTAAQAAMESDKAAIEAAEIALEGVKQEQQYGARTTLDVLDAERELFNTQVQFVTSQRDEVVAAYGVLSAVGRLTAESLALNVPLYDANKNFEDVEYQFIGF